MHPATAPQAQIEERAERSWKLRDMLHLNKLTNVAMNDDCFNRGASAAVTMQATPVKRPTLVGKDNFSTVEINAGLWLLPKGVTIKAQACLPTSRVWLGKAIHRDTLSGVLAWHEPVLFSPSMKLTLVDRQRSANEPKRLVLITLRSMPNFRGKATRDNVKVEVEDGEGNPQFYFAQCEAFFEDANGHVFVGLRWYDHVNQNGDSVDATVLLPRLKLRPLEKTRSYSVLPASCIHNGALIIAGDNHHWAVMSPREQKEYESFNVNS